MANVQHSGLTDPELHEPKGVASAASGEVYVADGAGSGSWDTADAIDTAKSLGASGHITLPGGFMIQWGTQANVAGQTTTSVSFPTAFSTSCFGVVANGAENHNSGADSNTHAITTFNRTTSGFTLENGFNETIDIFWIALGY